MEPFEKVDDVAGDSGLEFNRVWQLAMARIAAGAKGRLPNILCDAAAEYWATLRQEEPFVKDVPWPEKAADVDPGRLRLAQKNFRLQVTLPTKGDPKVHVLPGFRRAERGEPFRGA